MTVEFFRHNLGHEALRSVKKALDGLFLTAGPMTRQFETAFSKYLDCPHVVGTYSCTTALFLCLKALDIGSPDEVITTPMTFIATSNAILEAGATPVFVDVEPATGNMDVNKIEAAIGPKTRAIMPVHLYGHMCDMKAIRRIADAHNLSVIEDAAHCIEGEREGIRPARLSDAACFSFYATKNMTSGEGGAVATHSKTLAETLRCLRSHGMNKEAAGRYTETYRHWDMVRMGYKGNMFDIQAALLLPQIPKLEENLKKRQEIADRYREAFRSIPGIDLPQTHPFTGHACHLFTIRVPPGRRDAFLDKLQEKGIGVAVNYRAIHLLTYYRETFGFKEGMFPNAENIGETTISLPLYPGMTAKDIAAVIMTVKKELRP